MMQSNEIKDLVAALVKVQAEIRDAEKNAKGQVGHQTYNYANLDSVIDATRAPLAKHGLVVTQLGDITEMGPVLVTMLMHTSGQWLKSVMPIINGKGDAQGFGSATTYARRYSLGAITGITQTDDDGEAAAHPMSNVTTGQAKPPAAKPAVKAAPKPAGPQELVHCGVKMLKSKYPDQETGLPYWYCGKCRSHKVLDEGAM
jgi:hypothetical protein